MGWEPNPVHTPALRALEQSYNQCGYRTIIHTETGVGVRNSRNKVTNNQEDNEAIRRFYNEGIIVFCSTLLWRTGPIRLLAFSRTTLMTR